LASSAKDALRPTPPIATMTAVRAPVYGRPSPAIPDVAEELIADSEIKARSAGPLVPPKIRSAGPSARGSFGSAGYSVAKMGPHPTPNGHLAPPIGAAGAQMSGSCGTGYASSNVSQSTATGSSSSTARPASEVAYVEAMNAMWDYQLVRAAELLEPWKDSSPWHAGALAECSVLRVVMTGARKEAEVSLALVAATEALLATAVSGMPLVAQEVFAAEMLLLRCGLQVIIGSKIRALFNLRQCWSVYRKLDDNLSSLRKFGQDDLRPFTPDDLRGRINFGLGLFYLSTSLLPASWCPVARFAGFVIDKDKGKEHLLAAANSDESCRATLSGILLGIYHLDLEPDVTRVGQLLADVLARRPNCVLAHWAGSLLAWRTTSLEAANHITQQALLLLGEELSSKAVYLRYELGVLCFIATDWSAAYCNLRAVSDILRVEQTFLPYRQLVTIHLAAVCFNLEREDEAQALCKECVAQSDWGPALGPEKLRVEADFVKVVQVFQKHRTANRKLLAFEVMYFLRQLGRVPPEKLLELRASVREIARPYSEHCRTLGNSSVQRSRSQTVLSQSFLVEHLSALMLECIYLFYLGDAEEASPVAAQLLELCSEAPPWASYLAVHGLYWAGRIYTVRGQVEEARQCLTQAKVYKKYPFNITVKVTRVLDALENDGGFGAVNQA